MCSSDSGGSVYIRLLDRLLRAALVSMLEAALSECLLWFGGRFVSPAKLRPEVGCRSVEDSLAVFAGAGSGIVAVEGALLHRAKDTDGWGRRQRRRKRRGSSDKRPRQ
jgi:hypothetical protein